ncbi:MAG: tyrosine-type recombinase/integrase [Patescibacteria group bacterium]|nr:tyrosine-type recombinase/integrase [Patescibacteria group bacterium]
MTTLPHLDEFLLNLETNGYSKKTVYNYERDLKMLENFLGDLALPFEKIDKRGVNQYKAYLLSQDRTTPLEQPERKVLSARSVNRALSSLRSYLSYLIDIDYPAPVAPQVVKLVKTERHHARVAELGDLIRLIEAPDVFEQNQRAKLRNRAMLETLFSTGMRISELVSLNRAQIDGSGRIFIRGKGKKERFVYLTPRAYQHILEYLKTRTDHSPALFVSYRGKNIKSVPAARISANYLQRRIKEYRELLRINVPTSAHSLRHGFATYLAEQGANPAAIQILLGHESLDTTTRYVHASDRYAEETHRKFHPLKNKDPEIPEKESQPTKE